MPVNGDIGKGIRFSILKYKRILSNLDAKEVTRMAQLDCSRDLVHMIDVINKQEGVSQAIKEAGKNLKNYIERSLIIKSYADDRDNHGLAIYLPDLTYEANPYESLKFSAESNWSTFVKAVLQSRLDNGW